MANLKKELFSNLRNILGWMTNRKIVVIESDDWGSIRMPCKEVYNTLLKEGIAVDQCRYCKYDSLESEKDLTSLLEVLSSVKDKNGKNAVFTFFSLVANPDFDKIKECNFQEYHCESFPETLKKYPKHKKVLSILKEGIKNRLFYPQLHGREHLNIALWMKALQANHKETTIAFKYQMFGISSNIFNNKQKGYIAAFDFDTELEKEDSKQTIHDGANRFEEIFGYRAKFFTAPNGIFSIDLEPTLDECGINFVGTAKFRKEPIGSGKYRKTFHYLGQRNSHSQIYIIRNCLFEPSESEACGVNRCLSDIDSAFRWGKPAIISTHRVNFVGYIEPSNRDKGLKALKELLNSIVKKWPDVEFMNAVELGELIAG